MQPLSLEALETSTSAKRAVNRPYRKLFEQSEKWRPRQDSNLKPFIPTKEYKSTYYTLFRVPQFDLCVPKNGVSVYQKGCCLALASRTFGKLAF